MGAACCSSSILMDKLTLVMKVMMIRRTRMRMMVGMRMMSKCAESRDV